MDASEVRLQSLGRFAAGRGDYDWNGNGWDGRLWSGGEMGITSVTEKAVFQQAEWFLDWFFFTQVLEHF